MQVVKITLDNSCFDIENSLIFKKLSNLQKEGKISVHSGDYLNVEKWKLQDDIRRVSDINMARSSSKRDMDAYFCAYPQSIKEDLQARDKKRGFSDDDFEKTFQRLMDIVLPTGLNGKDALNKRIDIKTLAMAIMRKSDYFVTKDKLFHKTIHRKNNRRSELIEKRVKIEEEFPGCKIKLLDDNFLKELLCVIQQNS